MQVQFNVFQLLGLWASKNIVIDCKIAWRASKERVQAKSKDKELYGNVQHVKE